MQRILITIFIFFLSLIKGFTQLLINEIQVSNATTILSEDYYGYVDWIEIKNVTDSTLDLSNNYLSDNLTNKVKWKFPDSTFLSSQEILLIWADGNDTGLHTNFSLSSDGESVGVFDQFGNTIDSFVYDAMVTDISYGRDINDSSVLGVYGIPTPGSNNTFPFVNSITYTPNVEFSVIGGVKTQSFSLELSCSEMCDIYYTTDGALPTANSTLYSGSIQIDSTTIIRAVSVANGFLPSRAVTHSYLFFSEHNLPIISISTNPDNLWDDEIGIYTIGTNGTPGALSVVANWQNDWKRDMNIEYIVNEEQVLNQQAEMAIAGFVRNSVNKSIKIDAKGKYGESSFNYKFFDKRDNTSFKSLSIRNSGFPEHKSSIIRDGIIQESVMEYTDIDVQAHQPCVLYLNGEYWGVYKIRERQNDSYLEERFDVKKSDYDMGEYAYSHQTLNGSLSDYFALRSYVESNDLLTDQEYNYINDRIDISQCLDYHIANIYVANTDWPGNNVKFWRSQPDGIKWRWLMFDVDFGLGLARNPTHNTLATTTASVNNDWFNNLGSTVFIRNILKSPKIRDLFIQRFASHINVTFDKDRMNELIQEHYGYVQSEMPRHIERWKDCDPNDVFNTSGCPVKSVNAWEVEVQKIYDFVDGRKPHVQQHIIDYFGLSGVGTLTVRMNDIEGGVIELEDVEIPVDEIAEYDYFLGAPVHVKAIPKPGYVFSGWVGLPGINYDTLTIDFISDTTIYAVFEEIDQTTLSGHITSNMTLEKAKSPYLIVGDIIVDSNVTLTSEPGVVLKMSENTNFIVYGKLDFKGSDTEEILIEPDFLSGVEKWGAINIINSTDTSEFSYIRLEKASQGIDKIKFKSTISLYQGQAKLDHVTLIDNFFDPIFGQYAHLELRNSIIHSDITGDLINIKHGYALVDSCEFIGNNQVDTDAIDYDDILNGVITNNKIYGLRGSNSDGIDLGEESKDILVKNNFIYDCTDKGVSVGQASTCMLVNNVIYDCSQGVGIKDLGSYAFIDHQTFFGNDTAIACFEKNVGSGGGNADVVNTIISNSKLDVYMDILSNVNVSYSLSDLSLLSGTGNLFTNPLFVDQENAIFDLLIASPAINSGDPTSALDEDNSITDMGAKVQYQVVPIMDFESLKINEIVSSNTSGITDETGEFEDWFEIYNPTSEPIQLTNVYFSDDSLDLTKFNSGLNDITRTLVPAGGYALFWADGDTLEGANHVNFRISSLGEWLFLSYINGSDTLIIDKMFIPGNLPSNFSIGNYEDGSGSLRAFVEPTPEATNNGNSPEIVSNPGVVAVINEEYTYEISAVDYEADLITLSSSSLPSWLTFEDLGNGKARLTGVPSLFDKDQLSITVIATDGLNEQVEQVYRLTVTDAPTLLSIEEHSEVLTFDAYPNPVLDFLTISTADLNNDVQLKDIKVFSTTGQQQDLIFFDQELTTSKFKAKIDFNKFPQGLYIVVLELTDGRTISKYISRQ